MVTRSFCSRLAVEGGWYAILRIPATRSGNDLAIELLNSQGISVHPGHFYDLPAEGYLVISLLKPEDDFSVGISRLLDWF